MYELVGCRACSAIWIRAGEAETSTCSRCGKRHRVDRLRTFARDESIDVVRDARTALLAQRGMEDAESVAGFRELEDEIDSVGMDEQTFLTAVEIDAEAVAEAGERATRRPTNRRPADVVRAVLEEESWADHATIVERSREFDIQEERVDALLERMVRAGEVTRDGDRFRLL